MYSLEAEYLVLGSISHSCAEQIAVCTDEGYKITQKQNPLVLADLDLDGILDALVNNGALVCSESS